ncbi:tau 95 subunit of transcription factor TFIIIC [Geranomyces michiganensis]|nr:tau 95 subunit of transcription factor TFIIIC [Geranomyces michiganensis]
MSSDSYERAPSQTLPGWNFHVVEFPGYVKDSTKVLKMLGGTEAMEKAFAEDLKVLELRYRPDDPFSHPINGEIIPTGNLLLSVTTRRRKRQPAAEPPEVRTRFLGTVTKTCRFRALADYQWLVDPDDPIAKLRKSIHNFDASGIDEFKLQLDKGPRKNLRNMPPPAFSRLEWPLEYGYRQNFAVVKVCLQKDNAPPEMKLINRYRRQKFAATQFSGTGGTVPARPSPAASSEGVSAAGKQAMRTLFNTRPVWTRLALINSLPAAYRGDLKVLLPLYAYSMTAGPWRDTWIRYGYDPRLDPEARFYQIIDVRFMKSVKNFDRAKRLIGVAESAQLVPKRPNLLGAQHPAVHDGAEAESAQRSAEEAPKTLDGHIFDGVHPKDSGLFQACDVTDPDLLKLIKSKRHIRHKCHDRDGWYARAHLERIRDFIKRKSALAQGKEVDDNFEWDEAAGDSDHGEDNDDAGGGEDGGLPPSGLSAEAEDKVKSKVDELMRSLQTAQRGQHEEEEASDVDDGDYDYFDVFGDDEEED